MINERLWELNRELWDCQIELNDIIIDRLLGLEVLVFLMGAVFFVWLVYLTWKVRKR